MWLAVFRISAIVAATASRFRKDTFNTDILGFGTERRHEPEMGISGPYEPHWGHDRIWCGPSVGQICCLNGEVYGAAQLAGASCHCLFFTVAHVHPIHALGHRWVSTQKAEIFRHRASWLQA